MAAQLPIEVPLADSFWLPPYYPFEYHNILVLLDLKSLII